MELSLKNVKGTFTVSDTVFNCAFNKSLVHQVVVAYSSGARQGTAVQKNRAMVSGSNRKPWRQKGTGRARSGSIRSPIWRSGGVTFAAKMQEYHQKVNKKMYRGALRSILSQLVRQDRFFIVDKFIVEKPKTKFLLQLLKDIVVKDVLIIVEKFDKNLFLSARNLQKVSVCNLINVNPVSLITFNKVIITKDAIKQIEKILS